MKVEHVRTKVRRKLSDIIRDSEAIEHIEVHTERGRPAGLKDSGTSLEIFNVLETNRPIGSGRNAPEYTREISFQLVGYVVTTKNNPNELSDEFSLKVELIVSDALDEDPTLGGLVTDGFLQSTDFALEETAYKNAAFAQTWVFTTEMKRSAMIAD